MLRPVFFLLTANIFFGFTAQAQQNDLYPTSLVEVVRSRGVYAEASKVFGGWKIQGTDQGFHSGAGESIRLGYKLERTSFFAGFVTSLVRYPGVKAYDLNTVEMGVSKWMEGENPNVFPYWELSTGRMFADAPVANFEVAKTRAEITQTSLQRQKGTFFSAGFGVLYRPVSWFGIYSDFRVGGGVLSGRVTRKKVLSASDGFTMEFFRGSVGIRIQL